MVLKMFPSILTVCFCTSFFSTIVSVVYSLIMVADINVWMLRLDMGLVFILYSVRKRNILCLVLQNHIKFVQLIDSLESRHWSGIFYLLLCINGAFQRPDLSLFPCSTHLVSSLLFLSAFSSLAMLFVWEGIVDYAFSFVFLQFC